MQKDRCAPFIESNAASSYLGAVYVPTSGIDMSRNGVNKVETPDEAQNEH